MTESHSTENASVPPTQRRHRIAFCITELDPGGAEGQFVRLVTSIDRRLFNPEVVCLSGRGELVEPLEDAAIPVTCLEARHRFDLGVVARLNRHFRRSQPDLVQTFLFHANIAGRFAARRAGVRRVVSGIRVAERRRRQLWCDRLTDRLVDRHVCVSYAVAKYAANVGGLPAEKLVVIPNAIDAERLAAAPRADLDEFGIASTAPVILFVGRLDEQKRPGLLLDAFRILTSEVPDARLLIVGTGPLAGSLQKRASDLGSRVVFAGYRRDVAGLMKTATCLALPSLWEGMPNVVMEAMVVGTPVVAADAEGISELLQNGSLGSVVHEATPEAWSAALRTVLTDPSKSSAAARLAQQHVVKEFTVDRMVSAYSDLYRKLLAGADFPVPERVGGTGTGCR
ncbi:MAG: glycosyltransferase [Planctomycetaceae bacterium]